MKLSWEKKEPKIFQTTIVPLRILSNQLTIHLFFRIFAREIEEAKARANKKENEATEKKNIKFVE